MDVMDNLPPVKRQKTQDTGPEGIGLLTLKPWLGKQLVTADLAAGIVLGTV